MTTAYQVVDLFAGPGGLAEGFSSVRDASGQAPFKIAISVEKDPAAHRTLLLRAFLRQFTAGFPEAYYECLAKGDNPEKLFEHYPVQFTAAKREALLLELGSDEAREVLSSRLAGLTASAGSRTIVIGGPPCQAYSMAGRARNASKQSYIPEEDERHFLYKEYINILARLQPVAFVMENVKGLMSSSVGGQEIFKQVLHDLRNVNGVPGGYELLAVEPDAGNAILMRPGDDKEFLIHAEKFGVPQARHRLIIVGIRSDISKSLFAGREDGEEPKATGTATVRHVLEGMPKLRSGLSRRDNPSRWRAALVLSARKLLELAPQQAGAEDIASKLVTGARVVQTSVRHDRKPPPRSSAERARLSNACPPALQKWISDPALTCLPNHSSRGHMPSDLTRYMFAAIFSEVVGRSPIAREFPPDLAPEHKNWKSGKFADRFRVQVWDAPARTVTSHISQDGHYFIHPDATQCRSLTVREAARLQTFPDNYFFMGNQTQQYIQVGNAVPPLLAYQIGAALWLALQTAEGILQDRLPGLGQDKRTGTFAP
jgi:DNA (cytosine-5)-methyltransferase 1